MTALKATDGGKPIAFKAALAYSRGGLGIDLELSSAEASCKDFAGDKRLVAPGERHLTVRLGPSLQKDGSEKWAVWMVDGSMLSLTGGNIGTVTVSEADVSKRVTASLDLTLTSSPNKLVVAGGDRTSSYAPLGCAPPRLPTSCRELKRRRGVGPEWPPRGCRAGRPPETPPDEG